jgi:bacillithiol system protein YtxJ
MGSVFVGKPPNLCRPVMFVRSMSTQLRCSGLQSVTKNGFVELSDIESLDNFLAQSSGDPVIIFKHSSTCGISARAYTQMSQLEHPVGLVTVQTARAVSDEVGRRMGLAHETPQVMIVSDGKVAWTASHGYVKAAAVEAALEEQSAKGKEQSKDGQ